MYSLFKCLFLILVLMILVSCGHMPVDDTPAPIDNNFKTVEFQLCGQQHFGVGGCAVPVGGGLNKELVVPLFYKGRYTIRSSNCLFEEKSRYEKTSHLKIGIEKLIENRPQGILTCVFDVLIKPDGFDREMFGQFTLYDIEELFPSDAEMSGQEFKNGTGWIQIRERKLKLDEIDISPKINFKTQNQGMLYYQGCGHKNNFRYEGNIDISLFQLIQNEDLRVSDSCNFVFLLVGDDGRYETFLFTLNVFNKKYVSLEKPSIRHKYDRWLFVKGSKHVGLVAIDDRYSLSNKLFSTVKDRVVFVRMATANGRVLILKVQKGEIVWEPFIIY